MEREQIEHSKNEIITCFSCNGEGGFIDPDGLSAESCKKCSGTGVDWALKNSEKQYSEDDLQDA